MTNSKNEEKQKNTKRRLLLLILLLVLSVLCLTVSTVAWFTSNKRVSVDELQVNVSAVNGLEISAFSAIFFKYLLISAFFAETS